MMLIKLKLALLSFELFVILMFGFAAIGYLQNKWRKR